MLAAMLDYMYLSKECSIILVIGKCLFSPRIIQVFKQIHIPHPRFAGYWDSSNAETWESFVKNTLGVAFVTIMVGPHRFLGLHLCSNSTV